MEGIDTDPWFLVGLQYTVCGCCPNTAADDGGTWRTHGITRADVLRRMDPIRDGLPALWPLVTRIIDEQTSAGHLLNPVQGSTHPGPETTERHRGTMNR
jgi:hypothetical protein